MKAKSGEKQERPGNTYHMNDVIGREVNVGVGGGGGGKHLNNFNIEHSITRQDLRRSQDR